jgi:hypothetical protein
MCNPNTFCGIMGCTKVIIFTGFMGTEKMKNILLIALATVFLSGCTTRTEYGDCVGLGDDKNAALHYKVSVWNAFLGVLFVETIIVPIVVAVDEIYCPVGKK